MKIKYSTDADICIIELRPGEPYDSIDLKEGVILHLDKIVKQFYNGMLIWSKCRQWDKNWKLIFGGLFGEL